MKQWTLKVMYYGSSNETTSKTNHSNVSNCLLSSGKTVKEDCSKDPLIHFDIKCNNMKWQRFSQTIYDYDKSYLFDAAKSDPPGAHSRSFISQGQSFWKTSQ